MLNIYNQKNNNHDNDLKPMSSENKKSKADAGRFEDVTGEFSTSAFKRSIWFVTHKVLLYQLTVGLLVTVSIGLWVFSLWHWGDYVVNGIKSDLSLYNNLSTFPNYLGVQSHYAPQPVQIAGVNVYTGGLKIYDLVAEVGNPNKNFNVYFDYYFVIGDQKTPTQKGFLLANESRPLVYFGYKEGYPNGVNLIMENVTWKRISAHNVSDAVAWQNNRLNFTVNEFVFEKPQTADGIPVNAIKFNLTNSSAFGYRDGVFVIGLMDGSSMVGVMPLILKDFKSQETRAIDLRNFTDGLSVSEVKLFPLIDIYNKEVYLAPQL